MQDVGFHVLVWLVFLSRDTLFFWDFSRGAHPERLIWLVLCNFSAFSVFTFGYCLVYINTMLDDVIRKPLVGNKEQIVWFFILFTWGQSLQQGAVTFVYTRWKLAGRSVWWHVVTVVASANALIMAGLLVINPASAHLATHEVVWAYVLALLQLATGACFVSIMH
tara:strand:+ start:3507 stop:4001 length:495 start_codon:yes stop_codon:yes gene_type:complete